MRHLAIKVKNGDESMDIGVGGANGCVVIGRERRCETET